MLFIAQEEIRTLKLTGSAGGWYVSAPREAYDRIIANIETRFLYAA
jgi:hypothetical protein